MKLLSTFENYFTDIKRYRRFNQQLAGRITSTAKAMTGSSPDPASPLHSGVRRSLKMSELINFPEKKQSHIEAFLDELKPPESHPGRDILIPGVPQEWLDWPCHVEVSFSFNECSGVSGELFKEFEVNNLQEALKKLFDPGSDELFLSYRVHCVGITPPYCWDASWPLLNRGHDERFDKRGKIQGAVPWDEYYDDTLFEVGNEPLHEYSFETRLK